MREYPDINSLIKDLSSHDNKIKEDAWSYFLKTYDRLLFHCLKKGLSYRATEEDREDCFQEIITKLLEDNCRRLKQFYSNNEKAFRAFLGIIATRTAMNCARGKIGEIVPLTEDELAVLPDRSINLDQDTLRAEIIDIITGVLPEQERLVMLYYIEGLTLEEIADVRELKLGKVFEIKQRAFSIIKDVLKERSNKK